MDWPAIFEKAPNIAVSLIIVFMFLRHLDKRDKILKDISSECHQNQREATSANKETATALGEVRIALAKLNGRI